MVLEQIRLLFSLIDLFSFDQRLKFFHIVVTCNRHGVIQSSNTCKEFYYLFYVFPKGEKRKHGSAGYSMWEKKLSILKKKNPPMFKYPETEDPFSKLKTPQNLIQIHDFH